MGGGGGGGTILTEMFEVGNGKNYHAPNIPLRFASAIPTVDLAIDFSRHRDPCRQICPTLAIQELEEFEVSSNKITYIQKIPIFCRPPVRIR